MTPINIRKGDGKIRTVINVRHHSASSPRQPIFVGEALATGEEIMFLPKHLVHPRRVDSRGPDFRPTGIRWEPPSNAAAEREFLRIEEENARLRAELIRLSRA